MKKKRSLFEKLTGSIRLSDDSFDDEDNFFGEEEEEKSLSKNKKLSVPEEETYLDKIEQDGELSVDVLNNEHDIIIKAMIAGVRPEDLDIEISRDMVVVRGHRKDEHESSDKEYFHRELYWGTFSRTIILPEEIDVDLAKAVERHGLLIVKLPKVDKRRKARLNVKSE